jgi:type I restriction enzyme S subunit
VSDLPTSWIAVQLDEVCVATEQQVPDPDCRFLYIDISAIDRESKRITSPKSLLGANAPSRARKLVRAGDTLVSMTRPNLNAVAMVPADLDGQIASTGFEVLRAPGIDPRWVGYLVRTSAFVDAMSALVQGALYPAVRPKDVRAFPAPIAPRQEQQRIADKLDSVLARVDACCDRLTRVAPLLKRFRQSVLAAATSGRLTENWRAAQANTIGSNEDRMRQLLDARAKLWKGRGKYKLPEPAESQESSEFLSLPNSWIRGTLDHIVWSVKDGPHFSPKYESSGIPFISGGDVSPGHIDLSSTKFISEELHQELSLRCKPELHDVLYTKGGTTGIAAVNTINREFNVWVHVAVLKLLPEDLIDPFFVEMTLNSPGCYAQSQRYTHGVGNQDLGLTRMVKITLPLPPIAEQTEIVRRVEALFAFSDRLEARLAKAQFAVDRLTPALLAKAFRGELVPQDPGDEPATELLRRLAESKSQTPGGRKIRKTSP